MNPSPVVEQTGAVVDEAPVTAEVLILGAIDYCLSMTNNQWDEYDMAALTLNRVWAYLQSPWVYAKRFWRTQTEWQGPITLERVDGQWYVITPAENCPARILGPYKSEAVAISHKFDSPSLNLDPK